MRNSFFDVWVAILSGGLGYALIRMGVPVLPLAFGAVLGPLLEENLRRTLMIHKDWSVFFERPISLTMIVIALSALFAPLIAYLIRLSTLRHRRVQSAPKNE